MSAEDRRFFVYVRSGSKGPVYLTGPYDSMDRADLSVEPARTFAMKHDAWAAHYEFGVCSVPAREALDIKPIFADVPELSSWVKKRKRPVFHAYGTYRRRILRFGRRAVGASE